VGKMPPQREDRAPHWSSGDFVKVRPKTAHDWRGAHVLIQRGTQSVAGDAGGNDPTRRHPAHGLVPHSQEEPGAYRRSLDGADYEIRPSS
jgi:hypothetical protein